MCCLVLFSSKEGALGFVKELTYAVMLELTYWNYNILFPYFLFHYKVERRRGILPEAGEFYCIFDLKVIEVEKIIRSIICKEVAIDIAI